MDLNQPPPEPRPRSRLIAARKPAPEPESVPTLEELMDELDEPSPLAEALSEVVRHQRECPVLDCGEVLEVVDTEEDVLGIGMSTAAAVQLESLFQEHLAGHTMGEWLATVMHLRQSLKGLVHGVEPTTTGLIRTPEPTLQVKDDGPVPSAFDLTPQYRTDLGSGVVGIRQ